jgi:uncharacterized protein DUF1932
MSFVGSSRDHRAIIFRNLRQTVLSVTPYLGRQLSTRVGGIAKSVQALGACDEIYPSIMEIMNRMLPTYPRHAVRRCEELQEVEESMLRSGLKPRIVQAVREVTSAVANVGWPNNNRDFRQWTIPEIVEQIHREGTLQPPNSHSISAAAAEQA